MSVQLETPVTTPGVDARSTAETVPAEPIPVEPPHNPLIAGLPGFVIGSIALAFQLMGFVPPEAAAVVLPITFGASAISTLIATVWASRVGQGEVACIFATFTGFWVSYTLLVMALTHDWLKIPAADVPRSQELFLLSWLFVIGVLTLGSLRLPRIFSFVLILVDGCITFNVLGVITGSAALNFCAGLCALGFALLGAYLMIGAMLQTGGGKPFRMGAPLLRS